MRKKRLTEFFIVDMLIATDKIKRYFSNLSLDNFIENEMVFDAIMRELEIIGEALKHTLNNPEFKQFINKDWRKIINFRNVITHYYFGLNLEEIYKILCKNFPIFCEEFLSFTKKVKNKNLFDALHDAQQEAQIINHQSSRNI